MVDGLNAMKTTCKDITVWGSFLENHDVARFAFLNSDTSLLKNALSATLLADGIPVGTGAFLPAPVPPIPPVRFTPIVKMADKWHSILWRRTRFQRIQ